MLVASLAGCGGGAASPAAGPVTTADPTRLTVAVDQIPRPGFWSGVAAAPSGGFEHGLAVALAERLDRDGIRVVTVPFARIVRGDLGGADVAISDVSVTSERARDVDFSVPYLPAVPAILVRSGQRVPDLLGARELRWAVETGTTLERALDERVRPDGEVRRTATEADAIAALRSGQVDAVLLDLPVALGYARADDGLAVAAQLPGDEHLAVVLPKGSDNRLAVDAAIRAFTANGTLRDLGREWLGVDLQGGQVDDILALRTKGTR